MRRVLLALVTLSVVGAAMAAAPVQAGGEPAGFSNQLIVSGLHQPIAMTSLPDGRTLILEREGTIVITDPAAAVPVAEPYLTIPNVDTGGERGLLQIVLHPNFAANGYFYVYYANSASGKMRVSRFIHHDAHAHAEEEFVVWEDSDVDAWEAQSWHYGGGLDFGPDGKLYLTIGDKSIGVLAQDLTTSNGKVLRFNPNGTVPVSNPFYDGAGPNRDDIWALGLRNPFRASWDLPTGRFLIGEVGQDAWEDVHVAAAGDNFGWPNCEGMCAPGSGYTDPIYTYPHDCGNGGDCTDPNYPTLFGGSITGGEVYRGNQFPAEWRGRYFFGDYANRWIRYLTFDGDLAVTGDYHFAQHVGPIVSLEVGSDGSLYYLTLFTDGTGNYTSSGALRRISYDDGNHAPVVTVADADVTDGPVPLTVRFSGSASDTDGDALSYEWSFGDGHGASGPWATHTYASPGVYSAQLRVSDGSTTTASDPIAISVGTPPTAVITAPTAGETFRAGDVIGFSGVSDDPAATMAWTVLLGHDDHVHPRLGPQLGSGGTFTIPNEGHPYNGETSFDFVLTVTDAAGLRSTSTVTIYPEKVDLTLDSSPPGVEMLLDGIPVTTPYVIDTLIGYLHDVAAPNSVTIGSVSAVFGSWSDLGAANHEFVMPARDTTLTATYLAPGQVSDVEGVALFDPDTGRWELPDGRSFFFGAPGDTPLLGDWDCDGFDTVAMFRPSNGFVYLRNSNTQGMGEREFFFGVGGDIPLAGDWNGDGCDTLAIYRSGAVYVRNQLGTGAADFLYHFGVPGDRPFAGDFDGNGVTSVGLYRESSGLAYFRNALSSGVAEYEFFYGTPADRIVAGDWDGDDDQTVGIFRPADSTFYLSNENRQGLADHQLPMGEGGWLPTAGMLE